MSVSLDISKHFRIFFYSVKGKTTYYSFKNQKGNAGNIGEHKKNYSRISNECFQEKKKLKKVDVATPLWAKWENATPTPKSGDLESSGTSKNSEDDLRGQISLP
jgi:hypothetical protein